MKRSILICLFAGLSVPTLFAQTTAPASGKITYEGMRQIDRSQMRMNGQGPGGGDAPEGAPEVMSFTQKLVFARNMAKEERDRPQGGMMFRRQMGGDGAPDGGGAPSGEVNAGDRARFQQMRANFPMEQQTYLDLANRQRIDVMTIKKDSVKQVYRTARPMPAATDWQTSDKTKKIAGYLCHKATATHRKMTYTVWYTTDLPFTYSPVADLTPPQGVVLSIESDNESYKASNVSAESIAEASVQPPKEAKEISSDEMDQIRRKAMADFRQQMMQNMPMPRN